MSQRVHFQLAQPVFLGRLGTLEQILRKVLSLGYRPDNVMVGHFVRELYIFWPKWDDSIFNELSIAYEKGELTFLAFDDESFASFWIELKWPLPTGNASKREPIYSGTFSGSPTKEVKHPSIFGNSDARVFKRKEYGAERNSQLALDLVRAIYEVVSSSFGWIEICGASGYTKQEDVENLRIPHIYWANFFGLQYVEKYGKAYFQNAPGWKVEFQEDGGCLYVLSPTLAPTPISLIEEVRTYFEVEHVRVRPKQK